MNDQLSKIDHLAIIVNDIASSVEFYTENYNCSVKHQDETWAMLQFSNINLALVLEDEHPNHFALVDPSLPEKYPDKIK